MKKLFFLLLMSASCYLTASQITNSSGELNIPNIFGNANPANFLNGIASSIPNFLTNNNPAAFISGGGGTLNFPIPNIFGNNKPAQQINGGGQLSNPISNIYGNNQPTQQISGGGGSNIPVPNIVISNPASSSASFNRPPIDYQSLLALLAEIQPLMNSVVQQLQQQRLENIPAANGQSGIIVALLLQMRGMLQNELQTLLCSDQIPIVIYMEIQITTLLGQVNTALTLTAQQVPDNSNQALPVRSVLNLIDVGQMSSAPSMLNYICSLFNKGQ